MTPRVPPAGQHAANDRRWMALPIAALAVAALGLLAATVALSGGAERPVSDSHVQQVERFVFYIEGVDIDLIRAEGVDLATHQSVDGAAPTDGEAVGIRLTLSSSEAIERVVVAQNPDRPDAEPRLVIDVADVVLPEGITIDAHRICVSQAGSPGLTGPGDLDPAINEISANGWNPTDLVDFLDSTGGINLVIDQVWIDASEVEMDWVHSSLPVTAQMVTTSPDLPPAPCNQ